MKILLIFFFLFNSQLLFAEDISDFQIEGISIGDSLLNYMTKQEIQNEIDDTKDMYSHLSDKFAAIASVTGSMTISTYDNCSPSHPTPILQIHGLLDFVVPYNGNSGSKSISDVMSYWSNYSSCNSEPDTLIKYDNYALIRYETYVNCLNDVNIKLILHPTMDHTWPNINSHNISASNEIWDFVSQYNLYGFIN